MISRDELLNIRDFWKDCFHRRIIHHAKIATSTKLLSDHNNGTSAAAHVLFEQSKWQDESRKKLEHAREMLTFFENMLEATPPKQEK